MVKEHLVTWLENGTISIPNALLQSYTKLNLNEQELMLLLQVQSFIQNGNSFPTPTELSDRMTISSEACSEILRRLSQRGIIEIVEGSTENDILFETYSLKPLWNKLVEVLILEAEQQKNVQKQEKEIDVYSCFEQEFGRPLSPFECETLGMWLDDDQHETAIVKMALREAVISGKLNFRYIDRILFEWKKNGIKTVEQAKNHGKKFRQYQTKQKPQDAPVNKSTNTVPFYNWLEQ